MKKNALPEITVARRFLTFEDEKMVTITRRHWLFITAPIVMVFFIFLVLSGSSFYLFVNLGHLYFLFFLYFALFLLGFLAVSVKIAIEWYAHVYVVTTHKILELCYAPLFSHTINEILLDQVRVTEVDIHIGGVLNELLDIGTITITFDRPTHQEEFVLDGIPNPNSVGPILGDILERNSFSINNINGNNSNNIRNLWYRTKRGKKHFFFSEEPETIAGKEKIGGFTYATN